jgi:hypothetical protein
MGGRTTIPATRADLVTPVGQADPAIRADPAGQAEADPAIRADPTETARADPAAHLVVPVGVGQAEAAPAEVVSAAAESAEAAHPAAAESAVVAAESAVVAAESAAEEAEEAEAEAADPTISAGSNRGGHAAPRRGYLTRVRAEQAGFK